MRSLVISMSWILGGSAVAAALYWAFLNTPESTVFTLALSAMLALALIAVAGATVGAALTGWSAGWPRLVPGRLVRATVAFVPALLVSAVVWMAIGRALGWLTAHGGEISAWFIATLGWSDVRPLLNAARILGDWLRGVAVPFAALVCVGAVIVDAGRPFTPYAWLPRARLPLRLLLVTAVAALTLWAPFTYGLYWMPRGLPPTWLEPAVALVKFGILALVGALGLSLIARLAARLPSVHDRT
jgi:hypothetical protein